MIQSWNFGPLQMAVDAGGPVVIILMGMSLAVVTVFIAKLIQFLWLGLGRYRSIEQALTHWQQNQRDNALDALASTRNPIARVLEGAIELTHKTKASEALIREEALRIARRELARARSHLRILEVIATLSPLLGLLGTVLGMIEAFQKLQQAGTSVDPSILSGGIWEALLTTAAGLIVAIPAVLALNWLEQRIEQFKLSMEDALTQVFTLPARQTKEAPDLVELALAT